MKIILGSKNKSKKEAIELAFKKQQIKDFEIQQVEVDSHVSSKPLNEDTIKGAHNRNLEVLKYCLENNINFDLLISIEGGYEQIGSYYFLVTYASIIDKEGQEFIGKSQGLQITESMFEWVRNGKSLNQLIEEIIGTKENKKKNGISGFLTNGAYYRALFDSTAISTALETLKNQDKAYTELEETIKNK